MGITYFRRFRMEYRLDEWASDSDSDSDLDGDAESVVGDRPPTGRAASIDGNQAPPSPQGIGRIEAMTRPLATGYRAVPFDPGLIRQHATAKYLSFCEELDSNVFPCLNNKDGCLRLMKEITGRHAFIPQATWLLQYSDAETETVQPVGTIQGIESDGWGAIQNIGVHPDHRNRGLGGQLLMRAARGFYDAGLKGMHLEVTTENTGAVRFYRRIGFRQAEVVYKAAEVVGA